MSIRCFECIRSGSRAYGAAASGSILDEERRLIDKAAGSQGAAGSWGDLLTRCLVRVSESFCLLTPAVARRVRRQVFSIVDRDNSGAVDIDELKDMFKLFGVELWQNTKGAMRGLSISSDFRVLKQDRLQLSCFNHGCC